MERAVLIFIFLALFVTDVSAQTRKPIFRSIDVSTPDKKRSIELGGDLRPNLDIVVKSGDAFVLNGNFGNTDRIAVFLNDSAKVSRIVFDYESSRDFKKFTDSYIKDLGVPTIKGTVSSSIIKVTMVAWDDGKTRFEIVERIENGQISISSAMIDKNNSRKP
jgi:hypothetical protein